jgi:hypothetical protein
MAVTAQLAQFTGGRSASMGREAEGTNAGAILTIGFGYIASAAQDGARRTWRSWAATA